MRYFLIFFVAMGQNRFGSSVAGFAGTGFPDRTQANEAANQELRSKGGANEQTHVTGITEVSESVIRAWGFPV